MSKTENLPFVSAKRNFGLGLGANRHYECTKK